ncbi:hypothetical protein HK099_002866 [Clydaea vesicula]|uniref:Uncharacterized protein n=1 Tax=Clydaea vesicula TaxID=447962 RepID=A0AAD5U899_9FUNG|nr:hypothetical protein HK099_002866 [Clydaea vesicula]
MNEVNEDIPLMDLRDHRNQRLTTLEIPGGVNIERRQHSQQRNNSDRNLSRSSSQQRTNRIDTVKKISKLKLLWHACEYKSEIDRWKIINNLGFPNNLSDPEVFCKLHNFNPRENYFNNVKYVNNKIKVFDVFLFSFELDLLEVRLNELYDVIDKFVIIEVPCTTKNRPKELLFKQSMRENNFRRFLDKIEYVVFEDFCLLEMKGKQYQDELRSRTIKSARDAGAVDGDLFLFSELEEIPRASSIRLLTKCDFGSRINLMLDSFEFRLYPSFVFKSTVSVIGRINDEKIHSRFSYLSDLLLGDAGWHCSWCFRHIGDIQKKMIGYSHSDGVNFNMKLLEENSIEKKLCDGRNPFDYLPQAKEFSELFEQWSSIRSLRNNPIKFRYLLPGGCVVDIVEAGVISGKCVSIPEEEVNLFGCNDHLIRIAKFGEDKELIY